MFPSLIGSIKSYCDARFYPVCTWFPSLIGSIKRCSYMACSFSWTWVSIPYRKYKKNVTWEFPRRIELVSIPYRKYKKRLWGFQWRFVILVSIPYRKYKKHVLQKMLYYSCKVSIPYRKYKKDGSKKYHPSGSVEFPSLIGSIKSIDFNAHENRVVGFPSLIGSIKSRHASLP